MGQGSGSSSSAAQIVDEEVRDLTWKSKGKAKRKKDMVRRTLTCQRSSVVSTTSKDTFPPSA